MPPIIVEDGVDELAVLFVLRVVGGPDGLHIRRERIGGLGFGRSGGVRAGFDERPYPASLPIDGGFAVQKMADVRADALATVGGGFEQ
jgi:hypothetical protein